MPDLLRELDRRIREAINPDQEHLMTQTPQQRAFRLDGVGPHPIRGDDGAPIMGPRNPSLQYENPDILVPPETDSGTIPNLKYSFDAAHNRLLSGGWAREVTARELPIATQLAGGNMRLKPGG